MGGVHANCTKCVHTYYGAGACSTGDNVQRLSPVENTAVGVSAGVIEVVMLQPMLYCKNATQQRLPFTMDPRILYRGVGMSIINMGVLTGVQFPITGFIQRFTTGGVVRKLKPAEQIGCGFGGGFISGFICGHSGVSLHTFGSLWDTFFAFCVTFSTVFSRSAKKRVLEKVSGCSFTCPDPRRCRYSLG